MSKLWSQLPNAQPITDVIGLVKKYPIEFSMAYDAAYDAARSVARAVAWNAARSAVRNTAYNAACVAGRYTAFNAVWDAALDAALDAAYRAARDAILAFIAYDDSTKYLQMTYDQLRVWSELSENPAAILLLPYVKAIELIKAKT